MQNVEVRGLAILLGIHIPDFDDARPFLGANRHTHNLILSIGSTGTKRGSGQIAVEHLDGILAPNLQAVGPTADVGLILPQWREIAFHHTEKTIRGLMWAKLLEDRTKCLPALYDRKLLVALSGPGSILWLMKVDRP
jgi:hypothetical protein